MSPLFKGPNTIRKNMQELMSSPIQSASRKKAIATIAKKRNISRADARFIQAKAIAVSQARKK